MNDMMEYKDYLGSIQYSQSDGILYGKVEYIRSLISFEAEDIATLKASFQEAIDDYLNLCQERGIEPEKPFKGSFNVRVGTQLHRQAILFSQQKGLNLNQLVTKALESYLGQEARNHQ
ncbi:type II toxin-antitoxin system HicB family antitoxin [Merismopedia glauca]|uniref:Toxin-antitoxin system HicB family antitoxin n=1 Tax=Merismopedia glauca CCAP 1448/3 TaxID=1296344 RepID=A0A2T1C8S1_9CYAN|nr:type II toxin-antitoxin system HicB family antitoxin [Merismopedia glauca]PSB04682.1 toxin-antitoxin system HicB family antitoxin [Merismopedia glauca CCAP 1448/3]